MKTPSMNISASLRGQRPAGREDHTPSVSKMKGRPSMVVPGTADVQQPPGAAGSVRSANRFANALGSRVN